jgi:hypothetical protein
MKIEWKKNTHSWIGVAKTSYPRFEVWRSDNLFDDCWCLNITRDQYVGTIEVRDLPSLEDAKLFAEGSLKELDYDGDSSLPVTVHCHAEDTQMTCAANSVP